MNTKNTKTKIILSAIIFLSVVSFVGIVNAAGASLYVSPASLTKTAGNTFSVSVGFNASGSKVCAVEGTLVFNNLSCQSITVASDVMAQSSPTCSNPHFLIGIPNCTTSDNKTLLTLSVKAGNVGTASISPTAVDIIGEGASIFTAFVGGNYTITAPVVVQQPVAQPKEPSVVKTQPEETQETPKVETPTQQPTQVNNEEPSTAGQQASLATASPARTITIVIIVLLAIAIIGGGWYMLSKKKNK